MADIGTLLAQSRAHHAAYRRMGVARGRDAIKAALHARTVAHEADPDHSDAAWGLDTVPHETLMSFYAHVLAID